MNDLELEIEGQLVEMKDEILREARKDLKWLAGLIILATLFLKYY